MSTPAPSESSASQLPPELVAYYDNKPLMWRNVALIGICNIGWQVVDRIVMPLVGLRLLELGLREHMQATINSVNGIALSILVMYLGWKSDHTISRIGRRKPFLFLSAPFIIGSIALFPVFDEAKMLWALVLLYIVRMISMDIKASTFPLISIDCVRKDVLARANSVLSIVAGLVGFIAMRYAGDAIKIGHWLPFVLGAGIMTISTICAWWIKEPPIRHPTTERFKLWSTFAVAAADKRIFWLMAGVAMINSFMVMNTTWGWFWAKETLQLERGEIFQALSWAGLLNLALAYPTGWVIDRFGGLRVVLFYFVGQLACFIWLLNVRDKSGLILLSLATTFIGPLYTAADIMVYKSVPRKDVGSYTATNSCLRNLFVAALGLVSGWAIFAAGHNYLVGFGIGIGMSSVGLVMFIIHHRVMSRGADVPNSRAGSLPRNAPVSPL